MVLLSAINEAIFKTIDPNFNFVNLQTLSLGFNIGHDSQSSRKHSNITPVERERERLPCSESYVELEILSHFITYFIT